ncbi:XRE family transcriptional regulator [Lactococcus formosensis subsp. bovis]|uniref:XRE family transcriptional regulator n=1 Tax=Lactococcus formosensis TaxID=1281486 RepID=UPI001BD17B20|nr:XRE family transcriptional regulator [Lactococcus formosensis]
MNDKEINKYIGSKIREFRKIKGLTQKELAGLVGVKNSGISNYEQGIRIPKRDFLFKVANALNVSIDDFFPKTNLSEDEVPTSPLIEKTIDNMKKLTEEHQENVLKFSKMQLDEQKAKERRRIKIEVIKPKEENTPLELHPVKVKEHISLAAGLGFSYDETGEYATYYTDRTDLKCFDEGFPVDGDSMEPEIHDNDIALVKYNYNKIDGCIYAFDYDGKSYIKYLYFYDDRIVVKSANKDKYKDWEINFEELAYDGYTHFKIVGEVVDWFTPEVV